LPPEINNGLEFIDHAFSVVLKNKGQQLGDCWTAAPFEHARERIPAPLCHAGLDPASSLDYGYTSKPARVALRLHGMTILKLNGIRG
jgi:hypothetical protein